MKNEAVLTIPLSGKKQVIDAYDRVVVKMHLQKQQKNRSVFLICGTDPKVGATSASMHLAAGLAKSGRKVLLLDADMRKAQEKKAYGQESQDTLVKYLTQDVSLEDVVYHTEIQGLSVIPGGVTPDPVELLCSQKMQILLDVSRKCFDFVIIDIPSVGAAADANAVLGYVDQVVLVAAPERSYKKQILECYETCQKYEADLLGVIVNRVDKYGYHDYMVNGNYYSKESEEERLLYRIKARLGIGKEKTGKEKKGKKEKKSKKKNKES